MEYHGFWNVSLGVSNRLPIQITAQFIIGNFFNSGITDTMTINSKDSPTYINIGGTFRGQTMVMFSLLKMYRWFHVSVLLDTNTLLTLYKAMANSLRDETLPWLLKHFNIQVYTFNGQDNTTFEALLKTARATSRGDCRFQEL